MATNLGNQGGDDGFPQIDIPDHKLLRLIGQGSYGQVWIARSTIGTYRAVKIIRRSSFQHERPFEREIEGIRRFEPISRTHPGLVAILHVGQTPDGNCFYYVMELGDDIQARDEIDPEKYEVKTLASAVWDQGRLPIDRCIDIGLSLSDALSYLHSNDLIHRDVKPANIIFVAGYPKLADIGLVAEASTANTYVGTEGFIPPEGPNSVQGDVFSLGKTLYEISTGQDRNQFPTLPNTCISDTAEDSFVELIEIINHACDRDISVRYPTARAMHAEITALANGRSIKRLRLLERRMLVFTRIARMSVLILIPLLFLIFLGQREWQRRIQEMSREIGRFEVKAANSITEGDYGTALRHVGRALEIAPEDELNHEVQQMRAASLLGCMPALSQFWVVGGSVNALRFSKSNQSLFAVGDEGFVARFSLSDSSMHPFVGHAGDVRALDYDGENERLLSASHDRSIRLWNAETGELIQEFKQPASLWAIKFSPDGRHFASGGGSSDSRHSLYLWSLSNPDEPLRILPVRDRVLGVDFSADGKVLAVAEGGTATIWDVSSGELIKTIPHSSTVYDASFIDEGMRLATASKIGIFEIWDADSFTREFQSPRQNFEVRDIEESPDGRFLATAGWDSIVRVWNQDEGRIALPLLRHSGRVNCVRFDSAGRRIATGASDGSIRVWDLAGQRNPTRFPGVWSANRDGSFAGIEDRVVRLRKGEAEIVLTNISQNLGADSKVWLPQDGRELAVTTPIEPSVFRVRIAELDSPDTLLVDKEIRVGEAIRSLDVDIDQGLFAVAVGSVLKVFRFSPVDNSVYYSEHLENTIDRVFFSHSGRELVIQTKKEVLICFVGDVRSKPLVIESQNEIAYSALDPTDSVLAICESDSGLEERSAHLYRFRESVNSSVELRHRDGVVKMAFHPEKEMLVTASEDARALVWGFDNDESLGVPFKHDNGIRDVDYGLNGRAILTTSSDRTVQLRDLETALPIIPPISFPIVMSFSSLDESTNQILCQSLGGSVTWTWAIGENKFPADLLLRFADVLSGTQLEQVDGTRVVPVAWLDAKAAVPSELSVTSQEILNWHQWQSFHALASLIELPNQYRQEQFDALDRADRFHYEIIKKLEGKEDEGYLEYRQLVHQAVMSQKTRVD